MNNRRITIYGFIWLTGKTITAIQGGHYSGPSEPPTVQELRQLRKLRRRA